jgi:hypothetical protein
MHIEKFGNGPRDNLMLAVCILTINTGHFLLVQNPHMYLMAAVFSLTGYLGINFVLVLVRSFGALLAVTGTVTVM